MGRNYIEVGELLDSILPLYDVKLISINDNIDGLNNEEDSYLLTSDECVSAITRPPIDYAVFNKNTFGHCLFGNDKKETILVAT